MSEFVTGEAVALDLRTAALPSRLLAAVLDGLIQLALLVGLSLLGLLTPVQLSEAATAALGVVVLVLVLIVYPVAFETLLRGRTPGKIAMGLRVVRDDGGPIGFRQAFVRGLARVTVDGPATVFVGGVVCSLLNGRNKRIGDLLAGTVVLRERITAQGGGVAVMPPPLSGWAASLQLSGVSDDLAAAVRQFVGRADRLTAAAREDLGGRLVRAVTDAVGPPPPGTPGWAVLAAVLAERRRRDEHRLSGIAVGAADAAPVVAPAPADPRIPAAPRTAAAAEPAPAPGPGGFVVPG